MVIVFAGISKPVTELRRVLPGKVSNSAVNALAIGSDRGRKAPPIPSTSPYGGLKLL